ncbi:hypothetical protein H7Y21_00135 [Arenimonas sp.]|nr:hypothetical protein [Candidatus Parcubacteria bacterium]
MSEEQKLRAWTITDGPPYEKFVVRSNVLAPDGERHSVVFEIERDQESDKKPMVVNITGLTRHPADIYGGIFFFTGEYLDEGQGPESKRMYLIGSYSPNRRRGYFHILTKGEILQNQLASLMFGFTMQQPS